MPTDAILKDLLRQHVTYEIEMLCVTHERLCLPLADEMVGNALIESFCVHARNLWYFLNDRQGAKASDFTGGQRIGCDLGGLAGKIHTQITHLTEARTADPTKKIGIENRQEILEKLLTALRTFESHLSPAYRPCWPYKLTEPVVSVQSQAVSATNAVAEATSRGPTGEWVSTTTGPAVAYKISVSTVAINPLIETEKPAEGK